MKIIRTVKEMKAFSRKLTKAKKTIGFVPTMGGLHKGHLSLITKAKKENTETIVSIFVNPAQFGPDEDFQRYPSDSDGDLKKLLIQGVDAVFMPEGNEMYPEGFSTVIDVGEKGRILCGKSRPGHFNGVATVVVKLFNIVMPDRAYFGQKDYQQSLIIRKLVRELDFNIKIKICPVVREKDGLAMSSRNSYLNADERKASLVLYRALKRGEELIRNDGVTDAVAVGREVFNITDMERLVSAEYVEIVDPDSLHSVSVVQSTVVLCIAARIGSTRLIDNIIIKSDQHT